MQFLPLSSLWSSFVGLLLVASFAFAFQEADNWQPFSSEEYAFSAELPYPWQMDTTTEANGTKRLRLEAETENQSYLLTVTKYDMSTRLFMRERLADATRGGFVSATGGELKNANDWKVGGHVGKQALIKQEEREIEYRVVIIGQIQYQFVLFAKEQKINDREAKQLFNSFQPLPN